MLRRRCRAVMDEEYVQEHILTGGIVGPVGGASPTHSWPLTAISLGVVASYPTHLRRAPRSAHAWSALRMVARQVGCTDIASRRSVLWAAVRDCAGGQTLVTRRYDGTRLQGDGDVGRCGQQSG